MSRLGFLVGAILLVQASASSAQPCTPGAPATPEQSARRREGVRIARTINNLEANQPGARSRKFIAQADLATSPFAAQATGAQADFLRQLDFTPGKEIMPGWTLTLDVTAEGYWFMIRDKSDPCGFTLVSNQAGLIFEAQPLR